LAFPAELLEVICQNPIIGLAATFQYDLIARITKATRRADDTSAARSASKVRATDLTSPGHIFCHIFLHLWQ
jgi:hypothetical protein